MVRRMLAEQAKARAWIRAPETCKRSPSTQDARAHAKCVMCDSTRSPSMPTRKCEPQEMATRVASKVAFDIGSLTSPRQQRQLSFLVPKSEPGRTLTQYLPEDLGPSFRERPGKSPMRPFCQSLAYLLPGQDGSDCRLPRRLGVKVLRAAPAKLVKEACRELADSFSGAAGSSM